MGVPQNILLYVWYASTCSWLLVLLTLVLRRACLRYPVLTAYSSLSVLSGVVLSMIGFRSPSYAAWWVVAEYGFASLIAAAVVALWRRLTRYYPRMGSYNTGLLLAFISLALVFGWLGDLDLAKLGSNQIYAAGVVRRIVLIAATFTLLFMRLLFGAVWHTFPANLRVHFKIYWFFCAGSSVAYLTLTQLLNQRLSGLICSLTGIVACWWWVIAMSRYDHVAPSTEHDPVAAADRAVQRKALMQVIRAIVDSTRHQRCY